MRINNNLMAMDANKQIKNNTKSQSKSLEKLSSGLRINRAGEDDTAMDDVSSSRANLGARQSNVKDKIKNLDKASENLQSSDSRIRDVDMAKEIMKDTNTNILNHASTAILAQANQSPEAVLQLLR